MWGQRGHEGLFGVGVGGVRGRVWEWVGSAPAAVALYPTKYPAGSVLNSCGPLRTRTRTRCAGVDSLMRFSSGGVGSRCCKQGAAWRRAQRLYAGRLQHGNMHVPVRPACGTAAPRKAGTRHILISPTHRRQNKSRGPEAKGAQQRVRSPLLVDGHEDRGHPERAHVRVLCVHLWEKSSRARRQLSEATIDGGKGAHNICSPRAIPQPRSSACG